MAAVEETATDPAANEGDRIVQLYKDIWKANKRDINIRLWLQGATLETVVGGYASEMPATISDKGAQNLGRRCLETYLNMKKAEKDKRAARDDRRVAVFGLQNLMEELLDASFNVSSISGAPLITSFKGSKEQHVSTATGAVSALDTLNHLPQHDRPSDFNLQLSMTRGRILPSFGLHHVPILNPDTGQPEVTLERVS